MFPHNYYTYALFCFVFFDPEYELKMLKKIFNDAWSWAFEHLNLLGSTRFRSQPQLANRWALDFEVAGRCNMITSLYFSRILIDRKSSAVVLFSLVFALWPHAKENKVAYWK